MSRGALTVDKVVRAVKLGDRSAVRTVEQWCRTGDVNLVDPKSHKRSTLLHWAAYTGHPSMVAQLVFAGAHVDAQETDGKTPLHLAAYEGSKEVCSFLLRAGADWTITDSSGKTPCELALMHRHEDVARLFPNFAEVAGRHNVSTTGYTFDESMWNTVLEGVDLPRAPRDAPQQERRPQPQPAAPEASGAADDGLLQEERRPARRGWDDGAADWRAAAAPEPPQEAAPPPVLYVECSEVHSSLRGQYHLVDSLQEGMPVWEKPEGAGAAIYCNPDQLWLVHCEELPHETGLLVAAERHLGRMPSDMSQWESLVGGDGSAEWQLDPAAAVSAEPRGRRSPAVPPIAGLSRSGQATPQEEDRGRGSRRRDSDQEWRTAARDMLERQQQEQEQEQEQAVSEAAQRAQVLSAQLPAAVAERMLRIEQREGDERAKEERGEEKQRRRLIEKRDRERDEVGGYDQSPVREPARRGRHGDRSTDGSPAVDGSPDADWGRQHGRYPQRAREDDTAPQRQPHPRQAPSGHGFSEEADLPPALDYHVPGPAPREDPLGARRGSGGGDRGYPDDHRACGAAQGYSSVPARGGPMRHAADARARRGSEGDRPAAEAAIPGGGGGRAAPRPAHRDPEQPEGFEALQMFGDAIAAFDAPSQTAAPDREEKDRRRDERRASRRLLQEDEEPRRAPRQHGAAPRRAPIQRRDLYDDGYRARGAVHSPGRFRRSTQQRGRHNHYDDGYGGGARTRSRSAPCRTRSRERRGRSARRDRDSYSNRSISRSSMSRGSSRRSRGSSRRSRSSRSSVESSDKPPWRPPGSSSHLGKARHLGFDVYRAGEGLRRGGGWLPPSGR